MPVVIRARHGHGVYAPVPATATTEVATLVSSAADDLSDHHAHRRGLRRRRLLEPEPFEPEVAGLALAPKLVVDQLARLLRAPVELTGGGGMACGGQELGKLLLVSSRLLSSGVQLRLPGLLALASRRSLGGWRASTAR